MSAREYFEQEARLYAAFRHHVGASADPESAEDRVERMLASTAPLLAAHPSSDGGAIMRALVLDLPVSAGAAA